MYQDISVENSSGFVSEQLPTRDYLTKANFVLNIPNCPLLSQTAVRCSIPDSSIGVAIQPTPRLSVPRIGDNLVVSPFVVEFQVLSDLSNYMEVFNWMNTLVSDEMAASRGSIAVRQIGVSKSSETTNNNLDTERFYVDSTLTLCDRSGNPNVSIEFLGMIPASISKLDLDAIYVGQEPVRASVTFKYFYHRISKST